MCFDVTNQKPYMYKHRARGTLSCLVSSLVRLFFCSELTNARGEHGTTAVSRSPGHEKIPPLIEQLLIDVAVKRLPERPASAPPSGVCSRHFGTPKFMITMTPTQPLALSGTVPSKSTPPALRQVEPKVDLAYICIHIRTNVLCCYVHMCYLVVSMPCK